ncbi:cation:proton antiporter [Fodinibius sp. AD559]|uniref:cation:proton antiporter n=1 Tax=Fodinibius sp. AD559 TaxID=3424179 RepID=UPI00404692D1
MNTLLVIGFLIVVGYFAGRFCETIGIPKVIGYIFTGILFSPNTMDWISPDFIVNTKPLLSISLAFITFEVGGELKWSKIKKREKDIFGITLMASIVPLVLIVGIFYLSGLIFSWYLPFTDLSVILAFSLLLAALASPTDPTATLAVIHQYKVEGIVKDTILGVAAIDDALGIFVFSLGIAVSSFLLQETGNLQHSLYFALHHIGGGILVGLVIALIMKIFLNYNNKIKGEGNWIIITFSLIAICYGTAAFMEMDELLACMVMGMIVVNTSENHKLVFETIERYTEELIFLFFFVLSGLQLNVQMIPQALLPILLFVLLRMVGKYSGSYLGAAIVKSEPKIKKYTAGGLIPQGGIVIGLVLLLNQYEAFSVFYDILLAVVMGSVILNEIIGPLAAKYSLQKAGEIHNENQL